MNAAVTQKQAPAGMTRREREDLMKLTRARVRVAKTQAVARAAQLRADFEQQLARVYAFDEDEVWKAVTEKAEAIVAEARKQIADRCKELGIPKQFAPTVGLGWSSRGENGSRERRVELRHVATSKIDSLMKSACERIEESAVVVQTQLLAAGLETDEAKQFLANMPTPEQLMPTLDLKQIEDTNTRRRRYHWDQDVDD